ncbi:MAG: hypothetical protein K6G88_00680 [Lachnospiraceae bacterium]|nr:hypothetical protein [Lachnospiraceae bacterium]
MALKSVLISITIERYEYRKGYSAARQIDESCMSIWRWHFAARLTREFCSVVERRFA